MYEKKPGYLSENYLRILVRQRLIHVPVYLHNIFCSILKCVPFLPPPFPQTRKSTEESMSGYLCATSEKGSIHIKCSVSLTQRSNQLISQKGTCCFSHHNVQTQKLYMFHRQEAPYPTRVNEKIIGWGNRKGNTIQRKKILYSDLIKACPFGKWLFFLTSF